VTSYPASAALLAIAITAGLVADAPAAHEPIVIGGYRVVAADFHTHSSTWSDGLLTPVGLVLEAERRGLDAIAITGHNETSDAKVGRAFARAIDGPIVFIGQEILRVDRHIIAVGIDDTIDWRQDVGAQLAQVHRAGGIAIAAHPFRSMWPGLAPAVPELDGAEICHPSIWSSDEAGIEFEQFAQTGTFAAIGSSDFHGAGRMGMCRTFVFAREATETGVLDGIRARRTVVYGRDGAVYGDPALIRLAEADRRLRAAAQPDPPVGWLDGVSRISGLLGLLGLVLGQANTRARP
jgi:PHP domain-containing protein